MNGSSGPILRLLGSLKTAVVTLTALAVALAWGTIHESVHGTPAAQRDIYYAGWFSALLGLLAVNVAAAALLRYPWKRQQTGLVITHLGIIILLVGAMVGFRFGVDGHITLTEGASSDAVVMDQETLRVADPQGATLRRIAFDFERAPVPAGGARYPLGGGLALELQAAYANTRESLVVERGASKANPAFRVKLTSPAMGKMAAFEEWLLPRDPNRSEVGLGPAVLRVAEGRTPQELAALTAPPNPVEQAGKGRLSLDVAGQHFEFKLADVLGKKTPLGATGFTADAREYFADFRFDSETKKPASVSDQPNNPAVLLFVTGPDTDIKFFLFANHPGMNIARPAKGDDKAVKANYRFDQAARGAQLIVIAGPGGQLRYASHNGRGGFKTGELKKEATIETGLADWQLQLLEFIPDAKLRTELQPAPLDPNDARRAPALRVVLRKDALASPPTWVRWGSPTPLSVGGAGVTLSYGWEAQPLGFTVKLDKFRAKRYEGSEMPADFRSFITIVDNARGVTQQHEVWMNNPVTYPPDWLGVIGFKLSQASYREGQVSEANETTLGVTWDPGWPLKFLGFWTICAGIFIMYYMRTYFFTARPSATDKR
ncbi:MAG: cytochrome c biogenesis protein ResB [Verrucomicrobia bacterium]|nr:cytochrome c biogenesis protein ResB [Verrucomicrobiota bacterium]